MGTLRIIMVVSKDYHNNQLILRCCRTGYYYHYQYHSSFSIIVCSPIFLPVTQAGKLASSLWSGAPCIQDVSASCQFVLRNSSPILAQVIFILDLDYWSTLPLCRLAPNNVAKNIFPLHHLTSVATLALSLWRAEEGGYTCISVSIGGQPECINHWG